MLTYEQIAAATLESVKTAARVVETEVVTTLATPLTWHHAIGQSWSSNGGSKYAVEVYGPNPVWCYCACPYFRYHCEYVLSHAGSSRITVAEDRPPKTTNPEEKPMVCKHVWAVLELLKSS